MPAWPIVGRDAEKQRALEALAPGSEFCGAVLVGEAGVGKTVLAHSFADSLQSAGLTARFVLGTQTGQAVPLGAFHRSVPIKEAHAPAVLLSAAHRALTREKNLVVVVDDAHWLDPLSAILINQLAVDTNVRLIVTITSGEAVPDVVTALWKEGHLLRIDLNAFTRGQTGELTRTVLNGPVNGDVVNQLHDLASGNPMLLRGLINTALEDRVLVQKDGRWCLAGPFRAAVDLDGFVERRLQSLSPDEREVVEIVAAADVLDWDILRGLCKTDAIASTERRGTIRIVANGPQAIARLSYPILSEVIARLGGVARARQLNSLLAQQMSKLMREDSGRADVRTQIRLALFMLNSDDPPDLDLIIHAAASAVTMLNPTLGEQLARFAYDHGGGLPAAIVLGAAMSWQGRGDEAEALLMGFDPDGSDQLMTARWGCARAVNLFFACGKVDAAAQILHKVRDRIGSDAVEPITAMEASFAFFGNDLPRAIAIGLAALRSGMTPIATLQTATAGALALSGRYDEARFVAGRANRAAEPYESGLQLFTIGFSEILALTATGDLAAADGVCERYSAMTAGAPVAGAIVGALIGRVEYVHGRLAAACEALRNSLSTLSESFPFGWVILVAAWCAQAEAGRGNTVAAAAALAKAESAAGPQVAVFLPELELARAWERASAGETTAARAHAERAARLARRSGMYAVELGALHTAVRFGDRSPAGRLRDLQRQLATPLAKAMAAHGRGLADHDGNRLDDAATQFETIGAIAMAADAAAHAAREHARAGAGPQEVQSSARARWLAGQCGLHSPATASVRSSLPMTDREREVANLVAAGLTNRQIADRLAVSVRTVDGHLYRIFAKLGIDSRQQLARLIRIGSTR